MRDAALSAVLARNELETAPRQPLAGDASSRRYERIATGDKSLILMDAPPPEDVARFAAIARVLTERGYSAPEILAEETSKGFLLLEDLGDDLLARLIEAGAAEAPFYRLAADFLVDLAKSPPPDFLPEFSDDYVRTQNEMFLDFYVPEKLGAPEQLLIRKWRFGWRAADSRADSEMWNAEKIGAGGKLAKGAPRAGQGG